MKTLLLACCILVFHSHSFSQSEFELKIECTSSAVESEEVQFEVFLYNNSSKNIKIVDPRRSEPAWGFYSNKLSITDSSGKQLYKKWHDGATSKYTSTYNRTLRPQDKISISVAKVTFENAGTYQVFASFSHDPKMSPYFSKDASTKDLSTLSTSKKIEFIVKKGGIPDFDPNNKTYTKADYKNIPVITTMADVYKDPQNTIRLNLNGITQTELNELSKLKNLKHLEIFAMSFDSLPSALFSLNLETFSFSAKTIGAPIVIPRSISNMKNLDNFRINANNNISLPENLGDLKKIRYFYLDNVNFKSLPESFGQMEGIEHLGISKNNLFEGFPIDLSGLKNIKEMSVKNCPKLTSFPNLKSTTITKITLKKTAISTIPENINENTSLSQIWLGSSPISSLPESILTMEKLTFLDLYKSPIDPKSKTLKKLKQKGVKIQGIK